MKIKMMRRLMMKKKNDKIIEKIIADRIDNNKITMIYFMHKKREEGWEGVRILGREFVKNNKRNCKMIINNKKFKINDIINYDDYGINSYIIISYKIF